METEEEEIDNIMTAEQRQLGGSTSQVALNPSCIKGDSLAPFKQVDHEFKM